MRLSSLLPVVGLLPFLVWCGGDDSSKTSADSADGGTDGSSTVDPNGNTDPKSDGGMVITAKGDAGGNPSGTDPAWTTAPLKSPGCGKAAKSSSGMADKVTIQVGGGSRTYNVFVPMKYDPNNNYPVVFTFHGIDAQGLDSEKFLPFESYSGGTAIAVYPDGEAVSGGYRWDTSGDKDLLFFDAMLADIEKNLCINERRVFALGFSLGAYMVNHLGCKRSDVIRAFIPADGGFPDPVAACGKTTVLVYHRTEDDNEAVANGKKARDNWLSINGCGSTSKPLNDFGFNTGTPDGPNGCVQYDGCPGNTTVSWCEDMYVSPQGYKHDLRQPYRIPMWNWFNHF